MYLIWHSCLAEETESGERIRAHLCLQPEYLENGEHGLRKIKCALLRTLRIIEKDVSETQKSHINRSYQLYFHSAWKYLVPRSYKSPNQGEDTSS
jgi:hypothetical protein